MSTIEVMRKALEAMECLMVEAEVADQIRANTYVAPSIKKMLDENRRNEMAAFTALRAELERLEAVEPVAWGRVVDGEVCDIICPSEHAREPGSYTVPLYTAPIAPATIPALEVEEVMAAYTAHREQEVMRNTGHSTLPLYRWAYALAAERAGVQIKDTLQELADDAKQIGLEY